jgi:hypothetical protein
MLKLREALTYRPQDEHLRQAQVVGQLVMALDTLEMGLNGMNFLISALANQNTHPSAANIFIYGSFDVLAGIASTVGVRAADRRLARQNS